MAQAMFFVLTDEEKREKLSHMFLKFDVKSINILEQTV